MGRQIIVQPNSNLSVYSTIVDGFVIQDVTDEQLIEICVQEAVAKAYEDVRENIKRARSGEFRSPFPLTWEDAATIHNSNYPDDMVDVGIGCPL